MKFREVIEGEKKQRRKWHLNRIMSKFIGTRSHEQCRSHHQKMIKNYRSIDGIFQHFRTNAEPTLSHSDPSTSPTAVYQVEEPLNQLPEESIFNLLANPIDHDSEYIRIPLFYGEESNDMFWLNIQIDLQPAQGKSSPKWPSPDFIKNGDFRAGRGHARRPLSISCRISLLFQGMKLKWELSWWRDHLIK